MSVTIVPGNGQIPFPGAWDLSATGGSRPFHRHSHSHFQPFIRTLSAQINTLNPELRESYTPGGAPTAPAGQNKLAGGLPKTRPAPWLGRQRQLDSHTLV